MEFQLKLFPASGRQMKFDGRVSRQTTTLVGRVDSPYVIGDGGLRAQIYWKFQYDLNIGGFVQYGRLPGARQLVGFRVAGLSNIIQSFDIVPANRRNRPHTAQFRSMRGDNRPRGSSPWEWRYNHSRSVRNGRDGPSMETTTDASLPLDFSGSFSTEVSTSVGAELGWDLGPAVTVNGSVGAAAGASLDWRFRRTLEPRLRGVVNLSAAR
ncbi:MAG: hypothetical protein AB3N11_17205 [Arenibacterium sp.]